MQKEKNAHFGQTACIAKYVIMIYACSHMKGSASESKPFQSRSTFQTPGRTRREERLSLLQIEIGVPNWFRRRTFLCSFF